MSKPIIVPITPGVQVAGTYTLRLVAVDPTTGATVAGVTISGASGLGVNVGGSASNVQIPAPPPLLVPGPGE